MAWRFKHALIQDTAYESMLRARRREIQERIGRTLEQRFPEVADQRPELLARHFEEAGMADEATRYLLAAGLRAIPRGAHAEAITTLNRGVDLVATLPPSPARDRREFDLRAALNGPIVATRGYCAPELERNCLRARELGTALGPSPEQFAVLYWLWNFNFASSRREPTEACTRDLLEFIAATPDPVLTLSANFALGLTRFYEGRFAEAREAFHRGLEGYNPDHHPFLAQAFGEDPGLYTHVYLAWTAIQLGDLPLASEIQARVLSLAEGFRDPLALALALTCGAVVRREFGDAEGSLALAERCATLSAEQGFPYWLSVARCGRGWARAVRGTASEAIPDIEQGLAFFHAIQQKTARIYWLSYLAEAQLLAGRHDDGLATVAAGLDLCADGLDRHYEPELHRLKGELLLATDPNATDQALASFLHGAEVARSFGATYYTLRAAASAARVLTARGDTLRARDLLASAAVGVRGAEETPAGRIALAAGVPLG